ncbi:MAG: hypothetical protein FK731_01780 [Asgard group archaeon]|nr:hypothetical protein [Asgard group archaeon]
MSDENINSKKNIFEFTSNNLELIGIVFENGYFVTIFEKKSMKLGTIALSLPSPTNIKIKDITTATVIGSRNELITKALAEKITRTTNNLVYLSLNFQENNEDLFKEALKLVERFIEEITQ